MKLKPSLAFLSIVMLVSAAAGIVAQQPATQLPKSQLPELGRPTKDGDELPLFNFDDYFIGKWTFEWDVPEGVLGSAGRITGATIYRKVDGKFYEANTEATGPDGPFKMKELIAYYRDNKTLARHVSDSRGFSYMQIARIGGDLGGYYTIHYESAPFTYKGKSIRIKSTQQLLSPVHYKVATTVSVDGGPFMNYASPWWRKE